MQIDVSRETEAADLARFAGMLGLTARSNGTAVEIANENEDVAAAVTAWLADRRAPLVPTRLLDGSLALRPPAG